MNPQYIVLSQTSGPVAVPRPSVVPTPQLPPPSFSPSPRLSSPSVSDDEDEETDLSDEEPVFETIVDQPGPLQIKERQLDHFNRMLAILSRFYFAVDGSEMGTGKTFIAAGLALALQLPIIVVSPKKGRPNWLKVMRNHNVPGYQLNEVGSVMTYESLRSVKNRQPKHGLLLREDTPEGVRFHPNPMLIRILQAGVLLIFDEAQKMKNTSHQYHAAKAMMGALYGSGGRSRALFLSGTLMCKPEQAINFARLVRFVESRNLYSKIQGVVKLEGINELHTWAERINHQATNDFRDANIFQASKKGSAEYVFKLFTEVIKPGVMSIMPSLQLDKDIKNAYYVLEPEDEKEYRAAIADLSKAVGYNHRSNSTMITKENLGAVTKAQIRAQKAKRRVMAKNALRDLTTRAFSKSGAEVYPKVILFADYYEVIDFLMKELAAFNPVEVTGRLKDEKVTENIAMFQEPNLKTRLLIANPLVGGMAINLHDLDGRFPRKVYMMPGYKVMEIHQATHRVYRDGMESPATVRLVYGLSGARETSILNAVARKGEVMGKVHEEQKAKFPNEYEEEYERPPEPVAWESPQASQSPAATEAMIAKAFTTMGSVNFLLK